MGVDWELHQEILAGMQKSEYNHRVYNVEAKYLRHRRVIVDWMCEVGEEYSLNPVTIHSSVRCLDRLLGVMDVQKNKLQLVAMACILIAAKYEEQEDAIPTLAELNECSNNAFTIECIKAMEVDVLRALHWTINAITPIHFITLFQGRGIVFQNDSFEGGPQSRSQVLKYIKKYVNFFAELSLQEYTFQQYLPSVMSAAIIAASRRAVKIDPMWNKELERLTTHSASTIFRPYHHLYVYYIESFPSAPHPATLPPAVIEFERQATSS